MDNSTAKVRVLAIDAGSVHSRTAVAEDGEIIEEFDAGCILADRVGPEKALQNLKSALNKVLDGDKERQYFQAACVGMPEDSISKNAHITDYVQAVVFKNGSDVSNGPVSIIPDYSAAAALLSDRSLVLSGGARAWAFTPMLVKGGRDGLFANVGSGYGIGQAFYRMACELDDERNKDFWYIKNSITEEWVIEQRVVQTGWIFTALRRYDELKIQGDDCMNLRLGMVRQALLEEFDSVSSYMKSNPFVDFSSLAPLVADCAEDGNIHARKILEDAGKGLAGLVLGVRRHGKENEESDYGPNPVTDRLFWSGGVLENISLVREYCFNRLKEEIPDLQINSLPSDPIKGIVNAAQKLLRVCK